jgi:hypothetical protein
MVEVYVLYTVDVVTPVCTLWLPLIVIVSVTGQVVIYEVVLGPY